ncbi:hypothetical protein [Ktedonobacter sp. SOSP1-52]|uniref:hypothetical protein n=1 Tax=Ktedonobacter sp. SOSP1-52 TaxID=2778366 RepID=UPI00191596B7|nr:hypothetical protein [Ktedonobacter sp. SOSP1-52]
MVAIALVFKRLDVPEVGGVTYDEVREAGEHLPGMAALWDVTTPEERYEMITILLEPEGFSYDAKLKMIAALKPRPAFLPILSVTQGVFEYKETSELLVTIHWSQRNRRATNHRSHLALIPIDKLFSGRRDILVYTPKSSSEYIQSDDPFDQAPHNPEVVSLSQRRPGPGTPQWKIPVSEWPNVVRRIVENQEPLRKVAVDYRVSYETIRRVVRAACKQ